MVLRTVPTQQTEDSCDVQRNSATEVVPRFTVALIWCAFSQLSHHTLQHMSYVSRGFCLYYGFDRLFISLQ